MKEEYNDELDDLTLRFIQKSTLLRKINSACKIRVDQINLNYRDFLDYGYIDEMNIRFLYNTFVSLKKFAQEIEDTAKDANIDLDKIKNNIRMYDYPYQPIVDFFQSYIKLESYFSSEEFKKIRNITTVSDNIESIIYYEDTDKAKEIIKTIIGNKFGKQACIAIRALAKARIIYNFAEVAPAQIYRAIRQITGKTEKFKPNSIGTDSYLNRYRNDDTLSKEINKEYRKIQALL